VTFIAAGRRNAAARQYFATENSRRKIPRKFDFLLDKYLKQCYYNRAVRECRKA
jgi:hypothetical protein